MAGAIMRIAFLVNVIAIALASAVYPAARAAEVHTCDERANVGNIVEPWEKNTKTFYGGKVRVAYVDTGGEPICCSGWLLVLTPDPGDETGGRTCSLIGNTNGAGFAAIDFGRISAHYDAHRGLLVSFPVSVSTSGSVPKPGGVAKVRINVSTGHVTTEK